jgi:hypothetical protein
MPATTGMKGSGFYDRHSTAQLAAIQFVFNWIEKAIAEIQMPSDAQPFTILDCGSSEGGNALLVMSEVVEYVQRRRPGQLIHTIYSDLPSNNFNRLFLNLDEPRAAKRVPAGVYASATAGSFYEGLVPPRSIHFAMAFNALLWMDKLPCVALPNFVAYRRPQPPHRGLQVTPGTVDAFARQADGDLVRFLRCRADELAPGGKLLIASPGDSAEHRLGDGIYDLLNDACLDLVAVGRLARQRYERFTMPVYFRTVEETLAPLERDGSPVQGAFSVDRAETLDVPTPFFVEFDRSGDATKLADDYTGFLRAVSEPVARAALVGEDGDNTVLDELYEHIHARVRREPPRYRFRYLLTTTLFTRR